MTTIHDDDSDASKQRPTARVPEMPVGSEREFHFQSEISRSIRLGVAFG